MPSAFQEHQDTYARFVRITIGTVVVIAFVMIALVGYGFGGGWSALVATLGIISSMLSVAFTVASRTMSWLLPLAILAVFTVLIFGML